MKKIKSIFSLICICMCVCACSSNINSSSQQKSGYTYVDLRFKQQDNYTYYCNIDFDDNARLVYSRERGNDYEIIKKIDMAYYRVIYTKSSYERLYIYNNGFYVWQVGLK